MAAKQHERTLARRIALQVLYQSEILDESAVSIAENESYIVDEGGRLSAYASTLLTGVETYRDDIDERLKITSENWSLNRMPVVDRSILRLATYEMVYVEEVPLSVSINEAVELAKDFGGEDDSPRFVNGILGRIAKIIEEQEHE